MRLHDTLSQNPLFSLPVYNDTQSMENTATVLLNTALLFMDHIDIYANCLWGSNNARTMQAYPILCGDAFENNSGPCFPK